MISQISLFPIPFNDYGGNGPLIHFAHANGYPPNCYQPLFSQLTNRCHLLSMLQRPLWKGSVPNEITDWRPLSEDLIRFLNQQSIDSIIGIGHSLGGIVTLRAAINYPERFKALILIDPVLISPFYIFLRRLLNFEKLIYHFHPLIKIASRRRRVFPDRDYIFQSFRRKIIFQYLDDDSLQAYIQGITSPSTQGGVDLIYSPEWETRIYSTGIWNDHDIWNGIASIKIPVLFIRGNKSDTFRSSAVKQIKLKLPSSDIIDINNSTHLVPLEKPIELGSIIIKFLEERL